jgi:hypothetical protein
MISLARLTEPKEPVWVEIATLVGPVPVLMQPIQAVTDFSGLHAFFARDRETRTDDQPGDVGESLLAQATDLAQRVVKDWKNLDGPPTPANIAIVCRELPGFAAGIELAVRQHRARWSAEGNDSVPSPTGTTPAAEGEPTAEAATQPAPSAPPPSPGPAAT